MLKYYYSKGSSALAAHILLEEIGAPYDAVELSIPQGDHLRPDFLRVNPKGRIPVLETPDGVISENPALLEYLAAAHPDAGLVPDGLFQMTQARSLCAYLCATVHVAFAHAQRGRRWAETPQALVDMRAHVPQNLKDCADHLEASLPLAPWALGAHYSYCDPYLFLVGRWMGAVDVGLDGYPKLMAHNAAMRARPATQKVLRLHGLD